jgi:hypothetical protein
MEQKENTAVITFSGNGNTKLAPECRKNRVFCLLCERAGNILFFGRNEKRQYVITVGPVS